MTCDHTTFIFNNGSESPKVKVFKQSLAIKFSLSIESNHPLHLLWHRSVEPQYSFSSDLTFAKADSKTDNYAEQLFYFLANVHISRTHLFTHDTI